MTESAFPIINLQLQGMRHNIFVALTRYNQEISQMVQESTDKICTVENLKSIIDETSKTEIEQAIRKQIRRFFSYGDGKAVIEAAVKQTLAEKAAYYRSDEAT